MLDGKRNDVENFEIPTTISDPKVSKNNEAKTLKAPYNTFQTKRTDSYHKEKKYSRSDRIDFVSFILFTFAYILFNCFYMAKYTN